MTRPARQCTVATLIIYCTLTLLAAAELVEVKLTPGKPVGKRLAVAPGEFAELCTPLQRGASVSWNFRADSAMDFNIHYHVEKRVEYPEKREAVSKASGRLAVDVDQGYCWMWTNRSNAAISVDVTLQELGR
jgi:hypothetical protein